MRLQDWTIVVPNLISDVKELTIVIRSICLNSCLTKDDAMLLQASTNMSKAPAAYAGMKHLCRQFYISVILKSRAYYSAVL